MVVLVYLLCAVFIILIINHMVNYLNYPIKEGFGNPAAMMKMHHLMITNVAAVKVLTKRVDKICEEKGLILKINMYFFSLSCGAI